MSEARPMTFEERLAQIEAIASQLESGQLGLEESLQKYEDGMKGLKTLGDELDAARQRLSMIRRDTTGTPVEVPVQASDKGVKEITDDSLPF